MIPSTCQNALLFQVTINKAIPKKMKQTIPSISKMCNLAKADRKKTNFVFFSTYPPLNARNTYNKSLKIFSFQICVWNQILQTQNN